MSPRENLIFLLLPSWATKTVYFHSLSFTRLFQLKKAMKIPLPSLRLMVLGRKTGLGKQALAGQAWHWERCFATLANLNILSTKRVAQSLVQNDFCRCRKSILLSCRFRFRLPIYLHTYDAGSRPTVEQNRSENTMTHRSVLRLSPSFGTLIS